MCGRFTLYTPEKDIREALHAHEGAWLDLMPRFNIAPSQDIPIVRQASLGNELVLARWGLVPSWSKEPNTRYSTINARIETVAEKPAYRNAFKSQRCLIPTNGFYEWKLINGRKIPHYVHMKKNALFAFAGIWEHWEGKEGAFDSCSIIVKPASDVIRPLHERMPAIIAPAHYDQWLDSRITDKDELTVYLNSAPSELLRYYPVSTRVNSPKFDSEECLYQEET